MALALVAKARGRGEVREQPALADARLAHHGDRRAFAPGVVQQAELRFAADQAGRAQHGGRQGPRDRRSQAGPLLDQPGEFARLDLGLGAQLAGQQLAQAGVRGQRGPAVAAQVVQAHEPAVRALDERVVVEQALGTDQRAVGLPGVLQLRGGVGQGLRPQLAPALAGDVHPLGQLRAVAVVEAAQQFAGSPRGFHRQAVGRSQQVMLDARGQAQHLAGLDQVALGGAAQPEQPLAQVVACSFRVGIRPHAHGGPGPRHCPIEGEHREQGRVATRQQVLPAVRPLQPGQPEQVDAQGSPARDLAGHACTLQCCSCAQHCGPRPPPRQRANAGHALLRARRRSPTGWSRCR